MTNRDGSVTVDPRYMTQEEAECFIETWSTWMGYELAEWTQVNIMRRGMTKKQTVNSGAPSLEPDSGMWIGSG
jgi:hypothetical protein